MYYTVLYCTILWWFEQRVICTMLYYAVLYCGGGEQRIMVDVSNALF